MGGRGEPRNLEDFSAGNFPNPPAEFGKNFPRKTVVPTDDDDAATNDDASANDDDDYDDKTCDFRSVSSLKCELNVCCRITVLSLEDIDNAKCSIDRQRTVGLQFSPKNTFLATWEPLLGLFFSTLSSFLI